MDLPPPRVAYDLLVNPVAGRGWKAFLVVTLLLAAMVDVAKRGLGRKIQYREVNSSDGSSKRDNQPTATTKIEVGTLS